MLLSESKKKFSKLHCYMLIGIDADLIKEWEERGKNKVQTSWGNYASCEDALMHIVEQASKHIADAVLYFQHVCKKQELMLVAFDEYVFSNEDRHIIQTAVENIVFMEEWLSHLEKRMEDEKIVFDGCNKERMHDMKCLMEGGRECLDNGLKEFGLKE